MSNVFFFRMHKLRNRQQQQQQQQEQKKREQQKNRNRRMKSAIHCPNLGDSKILNLNPGRLFERPASMDPSDSLDYIALQIPRWMANHEMNYRAQTSLSSRNEFLACNNVHLCAS